MKFFPIFTFIIAVFSVVPVLGQTQNCLALQKQIDETYNFKPSKLSASERDVKSAAMDKVWNNVKGNSKELLPCFREEIKTRTNDKFFRFDAGNLLIQLDQSDEAKKVLIKTYSEVDLDDVNLAYWMPYIAILGYEGFDTSAAGENWLKHPKTEYYLPQHGTLAVNKEIGALIIYGSMDESLATPALAKIASQEKHSARNIAVELLLQQVTAEASKELKKLNQTGLSEITKQKINTFLTKPGFLSAREGTPKITRQQYLEAIQQLVNGKSQAFIMLTIEVPDGEKDLIAVMKSEDIPLIRKARRVFAASANPHSAKWYKSFTDILLTMISKSESVDKKESKN
jgi:hypothetical protein